MKNLFAALTVVFILTACRQEPYDLSTPEKFVVALGQAAIKFDEYYPIPYFYASDAAEAIQKYDTWGKQGKEHFEKFKYVATSSFPTYASNSFDNKLRFQFEGGTATSSFSFNATLIGDQIRNRKPDDYTFVSTETTDEGIVNITMTIEGNEVTIPTKMLDGQLKMFMEEKGLNGIKKMTVFLEEASAYYADWTKEIEAGEVTRHNLGEKVLDWEAKYLASIQKMNK